MSKIRGETMKKYAEIIEEWNSEADEFNQWENLSEEEKVEFAYSLGVKEKPWTRSCLDFIGSYVE